MHDSQNYIVFSSPLFIEQLRLQVRDLEIQIEHYFSQLYWVYDFPITPTTFDDLEFSEYKKQPRL